MNKRTRAAVESLDRALRDKAKVDQAHERARNRRDDAANAVIRTGDQQRAATAKVQEAHIEIEAALLEGIT